MLGCHVLSWDRSFDLGKCLYVWYFLFILMYSRDTDRDRCSEYPLFQGLSRKFLFIPIHNRTKTGNDSHSSYREPEYECSLD